MPSVLGSPVLVLQWSWLLPLLLVLGGDDLLALARDPRVVTTKYGDLQGLTWSYQHLRPVGSRQLGAVNVFLGVPYATPPIGSNRFSPTRALSPWPGIRLATRPSSVCPQNLPSEDVLHSTPRAVNERMMRFRPKLTNQSEDCLYLNIYVPAKRGADLYPVMVFIHGDSYEWSSGNLYDGGVLASYGEILVVTINYRLGIFGFLNTNEDSRRARVTNNGLLDQIAALHWIQENIEEFGGDPDMVTLFGQGTGAACISFLINSPAVVTNLFHRAILMSGSSLSSAAVVQNPLRYAVALGQQVGCPTDADSRSLSLDPLLDCLRERSVETLMSAQIPGFQFLPTFGPTVDGIVVKGEMRRRVKKSQVRTYDLMFGLTERDAFNMLTEKDVMRGFETQRRDRLLRTYVRNTYCYSNIEIFYSILNTYTNWSDTRRRPATVRDETLSALSDAAFVAPLTAEADLHSPPQVRERDGQQNYFYVFSYTRESDELAERLGSVHGAELPFVFGQPLLPRSGPDSLRYTPTDVSISQTVMTFWTNFAKTGDPNRPRAQPTLYETRHRSAVWEQFDTTNRKYLDIGREPYMRSHYRARQVAFWNRLVARLHELGERSRRPEMQFEDTLPADQLYSGPVRPSCSRSPRIRVVTALPSTSTSTEPVTSTSAPSSTAAPAAGRPVTTQSLHTISRSEERGTVGQPTQPRWHYSTILGVTVAIGCSLLVLNLLVFAGMYYQRKKYQETRKRFQGSAQPSTVSLDITRSSSTVLARRKSTASDCAGCKASASQAMSSEMSRTMLEATPPNGELNYTVPMPPPPPRGSVMTLPASESQPLLLRDSVPTMHAAKRPPPVDMDELRV